MTTEIIIATRNRTQKLKRVIMQTPIKEDNIFIKIMFDDDPNGLNEIRDFLDNPSYDWYYLQCTREHEGAVKCRNILLNTVRNNFIYATDDIIFKPNSIESAESEYKQLFPDNDGVLGFRQEGNHKFHPTGIAMVGINFLKKYPNQWLFYPGYFHFACQEILWHATKIGKFAIGSDAVTIEHLNPIVNREYMDQTHADARIHKTKDHQLMLERKKAGLIWGYNDFKI